MTSELGIKTGDVWLYRAYKRRVVIVEVDGDFYARYRDEKTKRHHRILQGGLRQRYRLVERDGMPVAS